MVLEESALSAVEAAADAVIGEHILVIIIHGNDNDDSGGHDKRWSLVIILRND